MTNHSSRLHGLLLRPSALHARPGAAAPRDTSASAASGTTNEFSSKLLVVVDQLRVPPARQHRHGEDLLHGGLEPQERDHLPGRQVDHADAAGPLVLGRAAR